MTENISSQLNNPFFSIIVPVYNVKPYLKRCVESLKEQSFSDVEIILVDDGSTDGSSSLCDELAKSDERIKVIHKENEGQGIARNKGLSVAKGDYVLFIDSDDYIEKDTCKELYGLIGIGDEKADMITFGYEIDSPSGECVRVPLIKDKEYSLAEIKDDFILHFFGDDPSDDNLRGFSACMSCFRRSVIESNHILFPSERVVLSEDTVFCLEFLKHADKVVTTSRIYYHYCQKADSFSQGYRPDRMEKTLDMLNILKKKAEELGVSDKVNTRLSMYVWVSLMANLKQEVRRDISQKEISGNIKKLCGDERLQSAVKGLKNASLPKKQKLFLWAYMNKWTYLVKMLCKIRATQRI